MHTNRFFKVLTVKPFLFLLTAEIFSQLAINMLNFVLIIVAFGVSNSNTGVSGVVLSFTIPSVLFGIMAGAYVDKWNKKTVLFMTNIIRGALVLLLIFSSTHLVFIYILTFAVSIVTQFFIPAEAPMIPLLIGKEMLLTANALFGMAIYASIFIAYALSGPMLLLFGRINVLIILTVFFILAGVFSYLIKAAGPLRNEAASGGKVNLGRELAKEIKQAFTMLSKNKLIHNALFLLTLAQILILSLVVIGPGYAKHILHMNIDKFPVFFVTPIIVGMIVGTVLLGTVLHKYSKQWLTTIGLFFMGLSVLLLPYGSLFFSKSFIRLLNIHLPNTLDINLLHIMIFLAFIFGLSNALLFVPSNTQLQEETTDQTRGKVYGILNTMVGVFSFIPILLVGGLADLFGIKDVLTALGFLAMIFALFRSRILVKGIN